MHAVPAPDFSNHTIQQLFDELHSGMVGSPVHQQAMFMLQFRLAEQQANTAAQQTAAAQAMVEPTQRLANSTRTLAWATILLLVVALVTTISQAFLTDKYVRLTDKLVRVQVEPIVKFDLAALGGDTVEMWNEGFEPVIDVRVNPEIVAFTGRTPHRKYRWSIGPGRERNDWWRIDRLSPGNPSQRKSLAELAKNWQTQLIDKQKSGTRLIKDQQRAAIIFRIT